MPWQDILITAASLVFAGSLIPQVVVGFKRREGSITVATSAPTFICLYLISVAYVTLDLYYSAIMTTITGTLWFVLFVQRIVYKKVRTVPVSDLNK